MPAACSLRIHCYEEIGGITISHKVVVLSSCHNINRQCSQVHLFARWLSIGVVGLIINVVIKNSGILFYNQNISTSKIMSCQTMYNFAVNPCL